MPEATTKEVKITTEDQVVLAATLYETISEKAVILLHMLGNNRQSWKELAPLLQKNGYNVLALDLRGHGQSLEKNKQKISYINFAEPDFQDMLKDIKAAKEFLQKQGASEISIVGASIGANLAIIYAAQDKDIQKIVALSPGLNFKGLKPQEPAKKLTIPIFLVAAEDDQYSAMSSRTLEAVIHSDKELKIYPKADHGTRMFNYQPELKEFIVKFLEK
ncbi:alpha/beta fold hydrolase [Candidatus Woesearchaeota archaeon]|nr:alpha/beta fold hydrolase [Candidatus Woesearchaeota archaeon]